MASSSSDDLRPPHGLRLLLELQGADAEGARYRAALHLPDGSYRLLVELTASGALRLSPEGPEVAPAAALGALEALARTLARRALAEAPPAWPQRLLRWRP